ncbi:MAG: pilus assembly FimT family protein [Psychrobacter alimentarius]
MNASANNLPLKQQTTSSGFTLIELMVTIAVLAIIVSIAAPNISTQLANQRVKSTAATLANALKEAKVESVIRRQNVTVTYNNANSIMLRGSSTTPIASYNYNTSSRLISNPAAVIFEPSKRVTTTITYTICDTNEAASPRQIVVSRVANISNTIGGTC